MPFKKVDMNAENQELQTLLTTSEEAKQAYKVFNEEFNFRLKLAKARKSKGLTQNQIKIHSGLTQQSISRIESGTTDDRSPTLRTVIRYLDAIGCELQVKPRRGNVVKQKVVASRKAFTRHQ